MTQPTSKRIVTELALEANNTARDIVHNATIDYKVAVGSKAHPAVAAVARKLAGSVAPATVIVQGDSTGTDSVEWVYLLAQWLATEFPARTVTHHSWDDSAQQYNNGSVLQVGTAGDRSAYATIANNVFLSSPDGAALSVVGDLDVRVKLSLDDWAAANEVTIASKNGNAGQRSWWFTRSSAGALTLNWSNDGTAFVTATSTVVLPALANGTARWVRASLDVDNGAAGNTVTFYTGTDGEAWTQLGTPVVSAGVAALFDNTQPMQMIGRGGSGGTAMGGKFYAMRVFSGATRVVDLDLDAMPAVGATFTDSTGHVWTINGVTTRQGALGLMILNASASGQAISYSNDATRFAKQTPAPADLAFVSYGHNEGTTTAYRAPYKQLADALIAKFPDVGVVAVTQNPQTAPRTADLIDAHALRFEQVRSLAMSQRYALLDAYQAFFDDGRALDVLISTGDGVHPLTGTGNDLWGEVAKDLFRAVL